MKVGYAAVPLDVPAGTPMGGYAARPGPSTGTLDPLQVAAVSISDGQRRFVWLVADVPCVNADLAAAVRAAVGPDTWLSATHTHAGPETGCEPGGAATPAPWLDRITTAARVAAARAAAAEDAATIEARTTRVTCVGGLRSAERPGRSVPVDVLTVRARERTIGAVVVLPVHPTVLDARNRLVSADLAGGVRRALAGALDGAWVVVATGAAGDVSTRPFRREQTPAECARLGGLVADAVVDALRLPAGATARAGDVVRVADAEVALDPKPAGSAVPVDALEDALAAAQRSGDAVAVRTAVTALQAARLAAPPPDALSCAVSAVTIGGISLVATGAEPFLALAGQLAPAVLVGYTNAYVGYLPTRDAYARADYEVLRTPVAAGGAERVVAAATALIARTTENT
ncbi:hypothetical protein ACQEVB_15480 [Pseudonocardia sp. CA-107938]|uniref:hypothetical protein n=1 Tax=Pseudonocardia sp. CA-107938 TaxID=3240021 RepID=UPI003D8F842F